MFGYLRKTGANGVLPSFSESRNPISDLLPLNHWPFADKAKSILHLQPRALSVNHILAAPVSSIERSRLEMLPLEIVLNVLAELLLESQACLAMCSRLMAKKLGTKIWLALRRNRDGLQSALWRYLQLVQRDKPSYYCCCRYMRLHSIEANDHAKPEDEILDPIHEVMPGITERLLRLGGEIKYYVAFHHVQLALTRHRYCESPDGRIDTLHYMSSGTPNSYATKCFNVEARVVSSHLLIRTQSLLEIDFRNVRYVFSQLHLVRSAFCPHLSKYVYSILGKHTLDICREFIDCHSSHESLKWNPCPTCDFLPICPWCPTETSLETIPVKAGLSLVVLTQWRDLGPSLTPENETWQAHVERRRTALQYRWRDPVLGLEHIEKRFEQQKGLSVEELTAENLRQWREKALPRSSTLEATIRSAEHQLRQGNATSSLRKLTSDTSMARIRNSSAGCVML